MLEVRRIINKPSPLPTGVAGRSTASHAHLLVPLLVVLSLLSSACGLLPGERALGGASPPPSASLSVSFIDVGQGDGVLVQAGGEEYLIDAQRGGLLEEQGVKDLDGIVVTNPPLFVELLGRGSVPC
jgi:beta-lactamase superfamily II metal-dependent hydrolase